MNKKDDVKYSAICEQGDLGLFGEMLSEADNKAYKESLEKEEKKNNYNR